MIFFWIGSLTLMLISAFLVSKNTVVFLANFQNKLLKSSLEKDFQSMLIRSLLLVLATPSHSRLLNSVVSIFNLRILGKRASVLLLAVSNVSAWLPLLLIFAFMQINAYFILAIAILFLFVPKKFKKMHEIFLIVTFCAIFLNAAEHIMKYSASLQMSLGDSAWAFFLADGRLPAVLSLFVITFVLSLFIHFEFWSAYLALALLMGSTISMNGAIALIAAERAAAYLKLIWTARKLNQETRNVAFVMGLSGFFGALLALFVGLFVKDIMQMNSGYGLDAGYLRGSQLGFYLIVILFVQFAVLMTVGHFLAQKEMDELQEIKYLPAEFIFSDETSPGFQVWISEKIQQRLQEIRYHNQGLSTYKEGQIPVPIQERLKAEEKALAQILVKN